MMTVTIRHIYSRQSKGTRLAGLKGIFTFFFCAEDTKSHTFIHRHPNVNADKVDRKVLNQRMNEKKKLTNKIIKSVMIKTVIVLSIHGRGAVGAGDGSCQTGCSDGSQIDSSVGESEHV